MDEHTQGCFMREVLGGSASASVTVSFGSEALPAGEDVPCGAAASPTGCGLAQAASESAVRMARMSEMIFL